MTYELQKMIDFLLENANPSIRLRVKKEVIRDISPDEERVLQAQILSEKIPLFMAQKQQASGWIGLGFHGSDKNCGQYDNQETATKYLGEKGLHGSELLDRAMEAFEKAELSNHCDKIKGKIYNEFTVAAYGANMIRFACVARAGYADVIDVAPQLGVALESFGRVTEVDSIFDVSRPGKKFRLFNENERWPCRYHLEGLAFTDTWKTGDSIKMLAEAFRRLMRNDRPEITNTPVACWVGHAVGPMWYLNEGYSVFTDALGFPDPSGVRRVNLEKTEWLCRCGLYPYLPQLQDAIDYIDEHIDGDGVCRVPFYEGEFRNWGPYAGLQLETDWRSKKRRDCDGTFRALLIMHYAGRSRLSA